MDDEMRWDPMPLTGAVELFDAAPFRWWVSGGHALELHLGRSWRSHEDTDIGIMRRDASAVCGWLEGWDLAIASGGVLSPWDGRELAGSAENNVWVRIDEDSPWSLDITVGSGDEDSWVYRRDPDVVRPWDRAVLHSAEGIPYLAPDLQLLFKSKDTRAKDHEDARRVIPSLGAEQSRFLVQMLPSGHVWRSLLADL